MNHRLVIGMTNEAHTDNKHVVQTTKKSHIMAVDKLVENEEMSIDFVIVIIFVCKLLYFYF